MEKCICWLVGLKILIRGKERLMDTRQLKRSKGMSLIEVTIAIAVLTVVMVGYLAHRYYTILHEKEADDGGK